MSVIIVNNENLDNLIKYTDIAMKKGDASFTFAGNELGTRYAMYLVEFMCGKLNRENPYARTIFIQTPGKND